MKKTYTAPALCTVEIITEGMIAASVGVGGGTKIDNENQFLSNKNDGYNPIWDSMEDE